MTFTRSLLLALFLSLASANAQTTVVPDPPALTTDQVLDRVFVKEKEIVASLASYTPMVETYIQNLTEDSELGFAPKSDHYFLGKLDLKPGVTQRSLLPQPGFGQALKSALTRFFSVQYLPNGFAQMILIDGKNFDRDHYLFEYVRREFLGEVRCLVFDVQPNPNASDASFLGRIWVEDRNFSIVRFNGTYTPSGKSKVYFHFDSWREQMGRGQWLPAFVYSEESDLRYSMARRKLRFKAQTRIWGYNTLEAQDSGNAVEQDSSALADRAWLRQAENNMLQRLQRAALIAPEGDVDTVLQTVLNNLEITNNLTIAPETRCRVLLTSPLESFSIGHTIVLSRGLIDVLPDEATLAMVLAHELAHIALDHQIDTKYAFNDRMLFDDVETFNRFQLKRSDKEERAADQKAMEFLRNSPYKDKLANAGLFLRALHDRADQLPNLLKAHMGNRLTKGKDVRRMADLMQMAPSLETTRVDQISALPLGGRLRLDPWSNRLELVKTKPVALQSAREKMPFEVTPLFLYLTRQKEGTGSAAARNP